MSTVFELFGTLTKGARAALPFLREAAETAASASEILRQASELGFAFRRQAGLDIIGALRNNVTAARAIRIAAPTVPLNPKSYGVSITKMLRNYSYTVLTRMRNSETGEVVNQHLTVSSNTVLSKNQILETAAGFSPNKYGDGMDIVDSIEVVDAQKSASLADGSDLPVSEI